VVRPFVLAHGAFPNETLNVTKASLFNCASFGLRLAIMASFPRA
jgi:hypothetical protein